MKACRVRAVLFFVVFSVLTQHNKYLINIGSVLHTYCEAEQLPSLYKGRRYNCEMKDRTSTKLLATISQQEQHAAQGRLPKGLLLAS